jgi:hypothetical protein
MGTYREEVLDGLAALVEFLREHPQVPLPNVSLRQHFFTKTEIIQAVVGSGKWEKEYSGDYLTMVKRFGPVEFTLQTYRDQVCERKVVGTKHHEARLVPEWEEELVEWECSEPVLKEA